MFARIGIVLLLVAPISIAGMMMWAMWDPSKYMRDIELAVVNEDAGVTAGGEYTNYGEQIVEGLLETEYLNFTATSSDLAEEGLTRGKYMMVVTIPQDFSEEAVTIISDNPVRPEIEFASNDYYGTNSSVITASLTPKVQTSVENAITKKYADKVITGLGKLSGGLGQAAEGAGKLDEGAAKLQAGGAQAVEGIAKVDDGAGQLANGMDSLVNGTAQLADGAGQIEGGVTQLTDMLIPMLTQAQQVTPELYQAEQTLRQVGLVEQADKIAGIVGKLDPANSDNMVAQLGKLRDGTALLHDNLSNPNSAYLSGVLKLQDGAHQLADGTGQLRAGGAALKDGLDQLKEGTGELSTKLADGAAAAPAIAQPDTSAQNMAVPITFTTSNAHPVQTVISDTDPTAKKVTGGVSMLLIQVFGFLIMLLISLLLPYYFGRSERTGVAVMSAWLVKAVANAAVLGILAVISRGLGWDPVSPGAVAWVIVAMSAAGAAVYQLLQVLFGRGAGGAVGLAFYALGVMVFGGVWPIAAVPSFLRAFHFVHPMTYAKMAFTRGTDGILDASYWQPLGALVAFTVIALAISVVALHARRVGPARPLPGQDKVTVSRPQAQQVFA